jgi:drug/metabolite transporter (DMT)-like permease
LCQSRARSVERGAQPAARLRDRRLAEACVAELVVAVTAIAFVGWYSAVRALGVERAGLLSGVLPISALVVAAVLGTADLTTGRLAGAVLVGAGIAAGLVVRPVRPAQAAR